MEDEIFKISKNKVMSKSLYEMAKERFRDIDHESRTYKIVEEYYEIIKELVTALMYSDGLKTLSHKMLIVYLENGYKEFQKSELVLINDLRKLRNNIVYYGQRVNKEFLINHEKELILIIKKLFRILNVKLKE